MLRRLMGKPRNGQGTHAWNSLQVDYVKLMQHTPHSSSWPRTSDSQSEDQQFESAMRYSSFPTDAATTSTGKTRTHWQVLLWGRVGFGKCRGGVMVASPHSKCGPSDGVRVRVPPSAQRSKKIYRPPDSHRLQVKVILPVSMVVPRRPP